jgi:hypothetical protein
VLSPSVRAELDALGDQVERFGKVSHHTPRGYPLAIATFLRLVEAGERPDPQDVWDWAMARGWAERDAHDLAEMADIVYHVLVTKGLNRCDG